MKLGTFVSRPKCRVVMTAIPAKETNLVESLVQDHDEQIRRLDAELKQVIKCLKTLEASAKSSVFLLAEAVKVVRPGELVRWKKCGTCDAKSDHFEVSESGEQVRFKVAGAYAIHLDAYHYNRKPSFFVCELRVGNDAVHKCRGVVNHLNGTSSSWRFALVVDVDDDLSVKNTCQYTVENGAILFVQKL